MSGRSVAPIAVFTQYAVQLKTGLSDSERDAALATLRNKYKLKIVKINKQLDIIRVAPRSSRAGKAQAPKTLGSALAPKIIQDLRKEPFVDAAYVDVPLTPRSAPRGSGNRTAR